MHSDVPAGTIKSATSSCTFVFHLERGEWKSVQVHWSLPIANVDLFGMTLTVRLEALERRSSASDPICAPISPLTAP